MPRPSKPATPSEYKVLGCLLIVLPFLVGVALLFYGYTASEEKTELANQVVELGWTAILISVVCIIIGKVIQKINR